MVCWKGKSIYPDTFLTPSRQVSVFTLKCHVLSVETANNVRNVCFGTVGVRTNVMPRSRQTHSHDTNQESGVKEYISHQKLKFNK